MGNMAQRSHRNGLRDILILPVSFHHFARSKVARIARMCYTFSMRSIPLKALLARVRTWPKGARDEAVKALREIEENFIIGPATNPQLDRSHQETLRGDMQEL